ncbi:MAG: hypothetical protein KBS43_02445 [Oscillospiraceae bacterium]|nr:hypothetical protein [Candidatus Limimonas coprohippi]
MEIFSLGATTEADYSILMAIVDFIPVLFYFLASWMVTKDLYGKVSRNAYSFLAAGSIMCFIGGAFKALWKVLFCFGINYTYLFTALFPMQAPGFCIYMAGLILALRQLKKGSENGTGLNVVAATVTTSLPLIMFQTIGSVGSIICMAIFAGRKKDILSILLFVLSIICLLTMGALGAILDTKLAWANWLEQGINGFGQILFYCGALRLHKKGYQND